MKIMHVLFIASAMATSGCKKNDPAGPATLTTSIATETTGTSAKVGGNITSDGGGAITARGVCWNTSQSPTVALSTKTTDGSGTGAFESTMTGLTAWTAYYVRAYATNSSGTYYGNEIVVVPAPPVQYGSVTDGEGNSYKTVVIGTKTWMAENLRATKYQNGASLLSGLSATEWNASTSGAYTAYNSSASLVGEYGYLYNAAVVSDARKVCPSGYHIPSVSEWNDLGTLLGGVTAAGGLMKETGTTHWSNPNSGATNASGFSGRAGGSRHLGAFADMGTDGYWWSAQPPTFYYLSNTLVALRTKSTAEDSEGLSIRCVKD